ncbi:hypothetical protein HDU89_008393 [Geranomyces variabilis]|nr:hypothetical protein HDU89_008393 [Geranomyces variabilis]
MPAPPRSVRNNDNPLVRSHSSTNLQRHAAVRQVPYYNHHHHQQHQHPNSAASSTSSPFAPSPLLLPRSLSLLSASSTGFSPPHTPSPTPPPPPPPLLPPPLPPPVSPSLLLAPAAGPPPLTFPSSTSSSSSSSPPTTHTNNPSHDLPGPYVKGLAKERPSVSFSLPFAPSLANHPSRSRAYKVASSSGGGGGGGGNGRPGAGLAAAGWKRLRRAGCVKLILCLGLLSLLSWTGLWTANNGQLATHMVPSRHGKLRPSHNIPFTGAPSRHASYEKVADVEAAKSKNNVISAAQDDEDEASEWSDADIDSEIETKISAQNSKQPSSEAASMPDHWSGESGNQIPLASDNNSSSSASTIERPTINGAYNPRLPAAKLPEDGQSDSLANAAAPAPDHDASRRPASPRPDASSSAPAGDNNAKDIEWYKAQYEATKRNVLAEIEKAVQADRTHRGDEQKTLFETTLSQRVAAERAALETEFEAKLNREIERFKGDAQNTVTGELDRIFAIKDHNKNLNERIFDPDLATRMAKTKEVPLYGFKMCAILEGALFNPWVNLGPINGNLMTANPPRALASSMLDSLALKVHDNIMSWADRESFDTTSVTRFACYMAAHGRNEYALMTDGMWLLHVNGRAYFPDLTLQGPGDATENDNGQRPGPRYRGSSSTKVKDEKKEEEPQDAKEGSEDDKSSKDDKNDDQGQPKDGQDKAEEDKSKDGEGEKKDEAQSKEEPTKKESQATKQDSDSSKDKGDTNAKNNESGDSSSDNKEATTDNASARRLRRREESKPSENAGNNTANKDDGKKDENTKTDSSAVSNVLKHTPPAIPQTPRLRYKLAYLLLVHERLDIFATLFAALYSTDAIFLIHVDSKRAQFKAKVHEWLDGHEVYTDAQNVFVMQNPFNLNWGASSIVFGQLEGFFTLMDLADWDYVINLSGYDYPIRNTGAIHAILERDPGKVYIEHWTDPETEWRLERAFFLAKSQTAVRTPTAAPDRRFALDHRFRAMKHHQWMILPRAFVQHLRHAQDAHDLLAWSEHSWIPDESYFAMVALAHASGWANRIVNDCKRFIYFEKDALHPIWLKNGDQHKLERGAAVDISLPGGALESSNNGTAKTEREFFFVRKINSLWEKDLREWMDEKRDQVDAALADEIKTLDAKVWTD